MYTFSQVKHGVRQVVRPRAHKQPVRHTVLDSGLFTAGWFGVREKHCFWLEIYDRLRPSEQVEAQAGRA